MSYINNSNNSNHRRSFGETFWEQIRCATAYSEGDFASLPSLQAADDIKPCLESLDLVDTTWTDKAAIQRLRDDLDLHLKLRAVYLSEKDKRDNRKFKTKNFIADKNFEAAKKRDKSSAISPQAVLERFAKIDFSSRQIKITDEKTLGAMTRVRELVMADNDISVLTCLPPNLELAVLSSNEIHRIQLSPSFSLSSLVALCVAGNCLSSLSFVDQLPSLACLDVSFNCIPAPIEQAVACSQVASHKSLTELHLQGNPLCISCLDWRMKVEKCLRSCGSGIKSLDGKPVTASPVFGAAASPTSVGGVPLALRKQSTSSQQQHNESTTVLLGASTTTAAPATTSTTFSHPISEQQQPQQLHQQQQSDMSVHFQVLNVRGISDLTQRFFDLSGSVSKVLPIFFTPTILDSMSYQFNSPSQYGGVGMVSANSVSSYNQHHYQQQQQQQITSPGGGGKGISSSSAVSASAAGGGGGGAAAASQTTTNANISQQQQDTTATTTTTASGANINIKKLTALQQQQQAAALAANPSMGNPGSIATHEAILAQWCREISTSVSVQVMWLSCSEGRVLQLDDLINLGGATNAAGEDLTANIQSSSSSSSVFSSPASVANASKNVPKDGKTAAGGGVSNAASKTSGGLVASSSHQNSKEAAAAAQREQQLLSALQAASTEFLLPVSRPTLSREVMLPLRLGVVLSVVPSASSAASPSTSSFSVIYNLNNNNNNNNYSNSNSNQQEPAPLATLGWASLSPADLISGYAATTSSLGVKLGVDRATLLTSRERVNKLHLQLVQIRASLEKEIAENSWRRDTAEQAVLMAQSTGTKNKMGFEKSVTRTTGGKLPTAAPSTTITTTTAASAGVGALLSKHHHHQQQHLQHQQQLQDQGGFSPLPVNPHAAGNNATSVTTAASIGQIQSELDAFFQNQIAARRRAEETLKKLVVEMALLNVLEGLNDVANGKVVVDGKFRLQKASPSFFAAGAAGGSLGDDESSSAAGRAENDKGKDLSNQVQGDDKKSGKGGASAASKNIGAAAAAKKTKK